MPLPKLNRFKDKHAALFDKGGGRRGKQGMGHPALTPTAWGESRDDFTTNGGASSQVSLGPLGSLTMATKRRTGMGHTKHTNTSRDGSVQFVSTALQSVQKSLDQQHISCTTSESIQRRLIIQNASSMVHGLPLPYLYSKPELRRYALETVFGRLLILAHLRERAMKKRAFSTWKVPPQVSCDDRQIGFVVVAQAFQQLLDRVMKRAFTHWSVFYASRDNEMRWTVKNQAAAAAKKLRAMVKRVNARQAAAKAKRQAAARKVQTAKSLLLGSSVCVHFMR